MDILSATSLIYRRIELQTLWRLNFLGNTHTKSGLKKVRAPKEEMRVVGSSMNTLLLTWLKTRNEARTVLVFPRVHWGSVIAGVT